MRVLAMAALALTVSSALSGPAAAQDLGNILRDQVIPRIAPGQDPNVQQRERDAYERGRIDQDQARRDDRRRREARDDYRRDDRPRGDDRGRERAYDDRARDDRNRDRAFEERRRVDEDRRRVEGERRSDGRRRSADRDD